ncbi:copper resistance CopC family protein [Commensalibacter nepenthis]|uniref:Copper resistance protein CopC n=1 Tax=Commensalibacter nepenthis TaxID=3043872 RepID=A0ABT6Q7L1_9PROT|nr:copper resistance protein CopC [Commensalibacter sp. TBRC 10068]MDI2112877.1 copper resistance protein CopC [Commensalibacter sp. TBRC 10068]
MQKYYQISFAALSIFIGLSVAGTSVYAIEVKSSLPKENQTLQAGIQEIMLKYDHEFNPFRSRLLLVGEKGEPKLIPATVSLDHTQVKTTYPLIAGKYKLQWQIWTWKGEESSGEIPFTVVGNAHDTNHSTANFSPAPATNGQSGNASAKQAPSN